MRLRRCRWCRRWTFLSRDLVWASRALGVDVICPPGRGCQRPAENLDPL